MSYDKNFVDKSEILFNKIRQNMPIQECLNTIVDATDPYPYEIIWFVYYMFFAIHNPKMEDYIQKKMSTISSSCQSAKSKIIQADIIKNMIKRRNYTSKVVFQLYTYAYTNQGNVTHIYPNYKHNDQLRKSHQSNHLKTTAVLIRRLLLSSSVTIILPTSSITEFIEYIISTAPVFSSTSTALSVINKINKNISYTRKDIILLTLACYMKIDEQDINQKNIFIAATLEEMNPNPNETTTSNVSNEHEIPSTSVYDEKYKYLYI